MANSPAQSAGPEKGCDHLIVADVLIGVRGADHILVSVLDREWPAAQDYWDGNWLTTDISIAVGGFSGRIGAALRVDEFRDFRVQLEAVSSAVAGAATFATMESCMSVELICAANGSVQVAGWIADAPGFGNRLQFNLFGLDQTFLPYLIEQRRSGLGDASRV